MSAGRVTVGHPVDVGSGAVFTLSDDFRIPGALEIRWRRHYSTVAASDTWLGPKWTVPYFMRLTREAERYVLSGAHGEEVYFPSPTGRLRTGAKLTNLAAAMELIREDDRYRVQHWHVGGSVRRFLFRSSREPDLPLAAIENLYGHRVRVEYDAAGRPVRLVQELERRALEITFDKKNLIAAIHFAADASRKLLVRYEYDSARRLVASYDALGHRKGYEYDTENRLTSESNPLGSRFAFEYDRKGRCIRAAGSDGFLERKLQYQSAPPMTRVTDSRGGVTDYHLNAAGQVVQTVNPVGGITTNTFDEHGRLVGVAHPDGAAENFAFDEAGNRSEAVDPAGAKTTTDHDENHVPTRIVDRNGNAWNFANRNAGSLLGVESLPPLVWTYRHDSRNLVTEAESWGGRRIQVRRDPRFRWQELHDQYGLVSRTEYDEMGFPMEVRDAAGVVSRTRYDELHRPVEVADRAGGTTRYRHDGLGNVTERVGPVGVRDTWVYDAYGHLTCQINDAGEIASYEYDSEGMLTAITNRVGERLEYRRDAAGRIVEEKLFDGRVQRYEYDLVGRQIKIGLADGRTVSQRFDPAGRLLCREASDGLVEEFAYDKEGREIKAWNNHAVVELKRNYLGRIVAEVQNGRLMRYRYDRDGNRIGRTLPSDAAGAKLIREYDARGRLIALKDERGLCQEFHWDGLDRLARRDCPGGVSESFTHDAYGRLDEQRINGAGEQIVRTHGFDASGNLTLLRDSRNGTSHHDYDRHDRLVAVRRDGGSAEEYAYDANQTLTATHRGPRRLTAGGRAIQDGPRELSHAADGSVSAIRTGGASRSLRHDVNGHLVEVVEPDGAVIRYEYDPFGRRTAKVIGDDRTEYLWEIWEMAAEIRSEEVESVHASADLRPLAQWAAGQRLTPVLDHRGAVREVFDESGRPRWNCVLDAYGNLLSQTGDRPSPFRLRGQYHDAETGLYYNYSRHYDPLLGDYTAPDPIGIEGGYHFYAYPRNPLSRDDPYGLICGDPEQHPPDEDPKTSTNPRTPNQGGPPGKPGADLSNLDDSVLYKIAAKDAKGRPYGSPRHPDPPTVEDFNPRVFEVPASELAKTMDPLHVTNERQRGPVSTMTNEELTQFRPDDPISGTPREEGGLSQTGGHHRTEEIDRRVQSGEMDPNTPVPVLVHD